MNVRPSINNTTEDVQHKARWHLRLIGGFELSDFSDGQKVNLSGRRERALLAFLALSSKGRQGRRRLAALIWGDSTDATLLDNLRTCVWRLRKALGDADHKILASDEEDIVLDLASFEIDVLTFRRLSARQEQEQLEAAASYCSGELLNGLAIDSEEYESWRRLEASCHLNQAIDVLSRLMRQAMNAGDAERALEVGSQILGQDPLHEETARRMMQLYAESGRRGAALQLYSTISDALQRTVAAKPESETQLVFDAIKRSSEFDRANFSWPVPRHDAEIPTTAAIKPGGIAKPSHFAVLLVSLLALLAAGGYWLFAPRVQNSSLVQTSPSRPLAIAVLPFDNLSGEPNQQYFSDGMTEEISATLAKLPTVELVARTSAYQFRGNKDARLVGKALGVQFVLEGAVRRMDNRVRITAQLIRTETGRLVWSETYERELTDVFAIQEDIARSIAKKLRVAAGSPTGAPLVTSREIDADSYQEFLKARSLTRARNTGIEEAIQILEPLVARNPNFAPAWALLAQAYGGMANRASPFTTMPGHPDILQRTVLIKKFWPKAEVAGRRAIQLDPNLPEGYYALGALMWHRGQYAVADDLYLKSLALDRYNPDALGLRMSLMADTGNISEATKIANELMALDPYVPTWRQDAAEVLWEAGKNDKAIELLKSIMDRPSAPTSLAMIYASEGRFSEAADVMDAALKLRGEMQQNQSELWRSTIAVLRTAPAKLPYSHDYPVLGRSDWAYLYVGLPEQALNHYESDVRTGVIGGPAVFGWLWHPSFSEVRKSGRFKDLVKRAGLVDYWQRKGWPRFCRPLGATDYVCH